MDYRVLIIKAGRITQVTDSDALIVGTGIKTNTGVNLTITPGGTDVVIAANKNLSAAAGTGAFDFSSATGTFKTSSGQNTIGGNLDIAAGKNVDFSTSNGSFKTTTGAVTIGPGTVTVSGATTFTAAGTALTVNNAAKVSGWLYADGGIDRSTTPATLVIGGANATTVDLGNNAATTTVNIGNGAAMTQITVGSGMGVGDKIDIGGVGSLTTIKGDLQVDGAETVTGTTTFNGNTVIGSDAADTLDIKASVINNIGFLKEANHTIAVYPSTTAGSAGGDLTVSSGDGNTTGAGGTMTVAAGNGGATSGAGGQAELLGGDGGAPNGVGGDVVIGGGDGSGTGVGGDVIIDAGNGATEGVIYVGQTYGSSLQVGSGANTMASTFYGNILPGTSDAYLLGSSSAWWKEIHAGTGNLTVHGNSTDYAVYSPSGITMTRSAAAGTYTITANAPTAGIGHGIAVTGGPGFTGSAGGTVDITGGAGNGAAAGGATTVKGGPGGATGTGGNLTLDGGAGGATSGAGGDVYIRGGTSTSVNGYGDIYIGSSTTNGIALGGGTTISAASYIQVQSGWTLNVPTGTSMLLDGNLNGSDVDATKVTGTNLNTLTNGSNADALHTHAAGTSTAITTTGTEYTGEAITAGMAVMFDATGGAAYIFKANAAYPGTGGTNSSQDVIGIATANVGGTVTVQLAGVCTVPNTATYWVGTVPTAASAGLRVYLSTTDGKMTLTPPTTAGGPGVGDNVIRVGWVKTADANYVYVDIKVGEGVIL